jgi:hypothetical protein
MARYPVAVVKIIESFCSGPSQVHFFPGLIKSRDGQFFSGINLDEELLRRVYGGNELATLRRTAPAFSLPEQLVFQSLQVDVSAVVPSLGVPTITMDTGDLPELDQGLLSDETTIVLSSVMAAGLNRSAASILISSWATEIWGMMTFAHRQRYLRNPLVRDLDAQAFYDPDTLTSLFKVSHLLYIILKTYFFH